MGTGAKFGTEGLLNACGVVVRLFEGDVAGQAQVHFNGYDATDAARVQGSAFRIVEGVSPKLLPHKDPHLHHPVGGF